MSEYGRTIQLRVEVDLWKWPGGTLSDTVDITNDLLNYRFQKTIKNPAGSCQMSVLPQRADTHILDAISPMDVVRIYEFGTLKFIGYVQRVSYGGSIGQDGKPSRNATITCQQMGGLLTSASVGLGLGTALGRDTDGLIDAAAELSVSILDATQDGISFAQMAKLVFSGFKDYLEFVGASNFLTYIGQYIDIEAGMASAASPRLPRTFEMFTGTEQSITFWQVIDQLVERPFNELWFDSGPRKVTIDGKSVQLPEMSCMVFRPVPFNGTVSGGVAGRAFDSLPETRIGLNHLLSFDLSRSIDEVFTMYSVKEAAFQLSDIPRILLGRAKVDTDRLGKYLLKPLITELFYTRMEAKDGESQEVTQGKIDDMAKESADTLYNWFSNNDLFLSGAISMMVPTDPGDDPKIGQKVSVHGIDGFFYVEGIAHLWNYQGPLRSDLTVTRGFNRGQRIELKDRIFRRSVIQ